MQAPHRDWAWLTGVLSGVVPIPQVTVNVSQTRHFLIHSPHRQWHAHSLGDGQTQSLGDTSPDPGASFSTDGPGRPRGWHTDNRLLDRGCVWVSPALGGGPWGQQGLEGQAGERPAQTLSVGSPW